MAGLRRSSKPIQGTWAKLKSKLPGGGRRSGDEEDDVRVGPRGAVLHLEPLDRAAVVELERLQHEVGAAREVEEGALFGRRGFEHRPPGQLGHDNAPFEAPAKEREIHARSGRSEHSFGYICDWHADAWHSIDPDLAYLSYYFNRWRSTEITTHQNVAILHSCSLIV